MSTATLGKYAMFKTFKVLKIIYLYPQRPMIEHVRLGVKGGLGEFGFTETLKHFFVPKIPEILISRKAYNYSRVLLYKYDLNVTSA